MGYTAKEAAHILYPQPRNGKNPGGAEATLL